MSSILTGKTILVIEDNAENRRLFNAILRLEGVTVIEAENAIDGVSLAREHMPDLILMDIQMPDVDGLTATRQLRTDPITAAIPIVAVTASVMERDRNQTIEAGCDGHIPKPIDPSDFTEKLSKFLASKQPAPSAG